MVDAGPLYKPIVAQQLSAPVVVCKGEKAASMGRAVASFASPNGANSAAKSRLAGARLPDVTLWPDTTMRAAPTPKTASW
jgi:hypothetical protein